MYYAVNPYIVNMHNCNFLVNGKTLHGEDIHHCSNNSFFCTICGATPGVGRLPCAGVRMPDHKRKTGSL